MFEVEMMKDNDIHHELHGDLLELYKGDDSYSWLKEFVNCKLPAHRYDSATIFIARDEDKVVGWAVIHPTIIFEKKYDNPVLFHEISIYVGTACRGKGYATKILLDIRDKQFGHNFIAFPKSEAGTKLFQNCGVKTFDRELHKEVTPWYPYDKLRKEYDQ